MNILGVIHARGGSVRVPGKNIKRLGNYEATIKAVEFVDKCIGSILKAVNNNIDAHALKVGWESSSCHFMGELDIDLNIW